MSASLRKAELAARRWARGVAGRIGTAPVSLSLLGLAALYLAAWIGWGAAGSREGAAALVGSWPYEVLAVALVVDAAWALARAAPLEMTVQGKVRFTGRAALAPGLVRAGQLLVALAFAATLLSHDRFGLRLAVGEEFDGGPGQFVERDPPRAMSPGPFPITFTLAAAEVAFDAEGVTRGPRATLDLPGAGRSTAGPWWPLWRGWGRFLLAEDAGVAVRYELSAPSGATVDSAFARLDLFPSGKVDSIVPGGLPHRIYVALAEVPTRPPPAVPALRVAVYRGKLVVAQGEVPPGGELAFEGLTLRFPEARTWVAFGMVRDPGIAIAILGLALAAAGLVTGRWANRKASRPA